MGKRTIFAKNFALIGVLGGVAIALGVPILALAGVSGGAMSQGGAIAITIISVLAGAPIVFVSAFFGIVIPSSVEKSGDEGHGHHEKNEHRNSKPETGANI